MSLPSLIWSLLKAGYMSAFANASNGASPQPQTMAPGNQNVPARMRVNLLLEFPTQFFTAYDSSYFVLRTIQTGVPIAKAVTMLVNFLAGEDLGEEPLLLLVFADASAVVIGACAGLDLATSDWFNSSAA